MNRYDMSVFCDTENGVAERIFYGVVAQNETVARDVVLEQLKCDESIFKFNGCVVKDAAVTSSALPANGNNEMSL